MSRKGKQNKKARTTTQSRSESSRVSNRKEKTSSQAKSNAPRRSRRLIRTPESSDDEELFSNGPAVDDSETSVSLELSAMSTDTYTSQDQLSSDDQSPTRARNPNPRIFRPSIETNMRRSIFGEEGEEEVESNSQPTSMAELEIDEMNENISESFECPLRKRSRAWTYFEENPITKKFKCKFDQNCSLEISGKASNLSRHLRNAHNFSCDSDSQTPIFNLSAKEDLNLLICEWIAVEQHPFSIIKEPLFKSLISSLGGELVSYDTLRTKYLDKVYNKYVAPVKARICGITDYSLTSDGWTTSLNKKLHWSTLTIHWINENWELESRLLDIGDLGISATAQLITDTWDHQIKSWNLLEANLCGTTLDGAANYKKAANTGTADFNIWCYCHRLHLATKKFLKSETIIGTYKKAKRIVAWINKSYAKSTYIDGCLSKPAGTRWNSVQNMFASLIHNQEQIGEIFRKFAHQDIENLSPDEWKQIYELESILESIGEVLCNLEKEKTPSLCLAYPSVYLLIEEIIPHIGCRKQYIDLAVEALNTYFSIHNLENPDTQIGLVAAFFAPEWASFRWMDTSETEKALEFCVNYCKAKIEANFGTATRTRNRIKDARKKRSLVSQSKTSIEKYVTFLNQLDDSDEEIDTLTFWKTMGSNLYKDLVPIVKATLCILAASTPSERVYSHCSNIITKKRNRLGNSRAKKLTYISVNSRLMDRSSSNVVSLSLNPEMFWEFSDNEDEE